MLKALIRPLRLETIQVLSAGGETNGSGFSREARLAQSTVSANLSSGRPALLPGAPMVPAQATASTRRPCCG